MAVKRRLSFFSGARVDIPHIRAVESSVADDFDSLVRGLITGLNRPYIVRGFEIQIPSASVPAQTLQVSVADSALLHTTATESGSILTVPAGANDEILNSSNAKVIGAFQSGVENYISLDYRRQSDAATVDNVAGWSASQQIEYQRSAALGRMLDYRFVISTSGFSSNLPLYIVKVSSGGNVEYITDARAKLCELGTGGASPNPQNKFQFGNLTNPQTGNRREWVNADPSLPSSRSVAPGAPASAFRYGDKSIKSLKDWMDAVMTRLAEATGSPYWYVDASMPQGGLTLRNVWWDSIGSTMTGSGAMSYNLVLESASPTEGRYQAKPLDSSILQGDSYVEGFTSGTKADLVNYNSGQLVINSMTQSAFLFDEVLRNRRLFRPDLSKYTLGDVNYGGTKWGRLRRAQTASGASTDISSWTYSNVAGADLSYSTITANTAVPHGYAIGNLVSTFGLTLTSSDPAPNGVYMVESVPSASSFTFRHILPLSGVTGVLSSPNTGTRLDASDHHPYLPRFSVSSWSYVGLAAKLVVPNHNLSAPLIVAGDTSNGSPILINLVSTVGLKLGMTVNGAGIPAGSVITDIISATSVEISQNASATASSVSLTFRDQVVISGLTATTNAPNGIFEVASLGPGANEVNLTLALTPTGTAGVSSALVRPFVHKFVLSVSGTNIAAFNLANVDALAISETVLRYPIGPDTLPSLGNGSGLIELDGVVAVSSVLNPVKVSSISNDGLGNLTVTTTVAHGLVTAAGPLSFTIFGNPSNSQYIKTYTGVGITYVSPTSFIITGTGIISGSGYTNPGNSHGTYVRFENNPYAGPVQWDSDIIVKGVIGDESFTIPVTATAATTSDDADVNPNANKFNTGSITGTVYLQDGEVAYVKLQRNKSVSNGATYSTAGGTTVTGPTPPLDVNGANLVSGDFIKWEDESEARWLKIAGVAGTPVTTNSFTLVDDRGQAPSSQHRPAKSGKIVYAKGSYSKVYVKKHWQVDLSGDSYWLAVRRDNGSVVSKVYMRNLELEGGEVRQINDNAPSNLLLYTGAGSEAAVNPNYSVSQSSGPYQFSQNLTVEAIDPNTRMVTFLSGPELNFSRGDKVVKVVGLVTYTFTVRHTISSRTVILNEDVAPLSITDVVQYQRVNYQLEDSDNLTLGLRKEDRELAKVDTALNRPIYDEIISVMEMDISGSGTIQSGSYIYKGTLDNPTALAWVLHGSAPVVETIETAPVTMPGGHVSLGSNTILVHILLGSFNDGDALLQNGVVTSRTVNNPGNPPFPTPSVASGVEIVLPPNRRTQVVGSSYVVYGSHCTYKASSDPALSGEELIVFFNGIAQYVDHTYSETFGGPKAKIEFVGATPGNLQLRARILPAYGSSLAAKAGDVTLQSAYNGGRVINEASGLPVEINAANPSVGETALAIAGSITIDGGPSQLGGLFGNADQNFVIGDESNKPKEAWSALEAVKTHVSHPDSAVKRITAAQTIVGAGPTTITTSAVTLPDNKALRIKISATVRRTDGPHGIASFAIEGTFYREGGAPDPAGYPISNVFGASGDGLNYALAFGISGNDIVAVAYGSAGATTQWALTIESQSVGLSS